MKVIICGAGKVGTSIAKHLVSQKNDVTVIDQSPDLINDLREKVDLKTIIGSASNPSILKNAGAEAKVGGKSLKLPPIVETQASPTIKRLNHVIDEHEAMLKRIRKKGKVVALESANKNYETKIFGPDRVKVQGVLVSLYRNF